MVPNSSCRHMPRRAGERYSCTAFAAPPAAAAAAAVDVPAPPTAAAAAARSHRRCARRYRALDVAAAAAAVSATAVALMLPNAAVSLQLVPSPKLTQRRGPMLKGHGLQFLQKHTLPGSTSGRTGSLECVGWSQRGRGEPALDWGSRGRLGLGFGYHLSGSPVQAAAAAVNGGGGGGDGGSGGGSGVVSMSLKSPSSSSSSPTSSRSSSSSSSSSGLPEGGVSGDSGGGGGGGGGGESLTNSLQPSHCTDNGAGGGAGVGGVGGCDDGAGGVCVQAVSPIASAEEGHRLSHEKESRGDGRKRWGLPWRENKNKNRNQSDVSTATAVMTAAEQHQQQQQLQRVGGTGRDGGGEDGSDTIRTGPFTYDWEKGGRVKWVASKRSKATVEEGGRKLSDYLALPPTEYSLLDPKMITRLTEDTFSMDCGTLNIVGTKVNPVLFVRVEVEPEQSQANIMVERVELGGSEAVRSAGGTFNVTSSTVVSCAGLEDEGPGDPDRRLLQLRTGANIEIEMLVPNENFVPLGVLRRAGSFVMQRVLDIGLPQFTRFLKRDYGRWAEGDDERGAVATAEESLIASDA